MWITLWWSDHPDEDFGADRPNCSDDSQDTDCIFEPWRNYKMCVVMQYEEKDSDPGARLPPSLAEALRSAKNQFDPHTWCSNPYIELGTGNSRTNCIGCHQHAGSKAEFPEGHPDHGSDNDVEPDDIILAGAPWPSGQPNDKKSGVGSPHHWEVLQRFPDGSRSKVRTNFPADYLWSYSHMPDFFKENINRLVDDFQAN